jgi:hypothetical protein
MQVAVNVNPIENNIVIVVSHNTVTVVIRMVEVSTLK